MSERTPVLSLGAGVQSSAMLLMAAEGEFGAVPELAIFADTKREPDGREQYVSSSMVPLPMVQTVEDLGQVTFDAECEGMCGV